MRSDGINEMWRLCTLHSARKENGDKKPVAIYDGVWCIT